MATPLPPPLSGADSKSFAYTTIKDRLPVILTRMVDTLCRQKDSIVQQLGKECYDEIKQVIGSLSQLKNEMQTNKPLRQFNTEEIVHKGEHDDTEEWNRVLREYEDTNGQKARWFTAPWLLVECYMYKAIHFYLQKTSKFSSYDICEHEKYLTMENSRGSIDRLEKFLMQSCALTDSHKIEEAFTNMLQVSVWGNCSDLSISGGEAPSVSRGEKEEEDYSVSLQRLSLNLLTDDSSAVYRHLVSVSADMRKVAIVLDNAGYELLTDMALCLFLLEKGLACSVSLYVKTRPWFVSDTLSGDVTSAVQFLATAGNKNFHNAWTQQRDKIRVREHSFWTLSHSFPAMEDMAPDLYAELSSHCLLIFKGDLNYRKLVSDLCWPPSTPLSTALLSFTGLTTPLCALRTVKGGPAVGVSPEVLREVSSRLPKWDTSGECGMLQFWKP